MVYVLEFRSLILPLAPKSKAPILGIAPEMVERLRQIRVGAKLVFARDRWERHGKRLRQLTRAVEICPYRKRH